MDNVPQAWAFVLLALAAFRLVRLIGWDDLTITPRRWITGVGDDQHHRLAHWIEQQLQEGLDPWQAVGEKHGEGYDASPPISPRRFYFSKLIRCPWCIGFWVSLGVYAAWLEWPHASLAASAPLALSATIGLVAKQLDP